MEDITMSKLQRGLKGFKGLNLLVKDMKKKLNLLSRKIEKEKAQFKKRGRF
jgi:hypothetical protein